MFNILLDELKTEYDGLKIDTDFRTVLSYELLAEDEDISQDDKLGIMIYMFFGPVDFKEHNVQDLLGYITNFINRGIEETVKKKKTIYVGDEDDDIEEKQEKFFDFNIDADLVFSAFLQIYHIDLESTELHWWKFLSLFNGLPDATRLSFIISKRAEKIPKANSGNAEYIANLKEFKKTYSLAKEKKKTSIGKQLNSIFDMW